MSEKDIVTCPKCDNSRDNYIWCGLNRCRSCFATWPIDEVKPPVTLADCVDIAVAVCKEAEERRRNSESATPQDTPSLGDIVNSKGEKIRLYDFPSQPVLDAKFFDEPDPNGPSKGWSNEDKPVDGCDCSWCQHLRTGEPMKPQAQYKGQPWYTDCRLPKDTIYKLPKGQWK